MKYYKFQWNETRNDEFDNWGFCIYYVETDENFYPSRHIELYQNGNVLKYDKRHLFDKFGMLADQPIENSMKDSKASEISKNDFEEIWISYSAINY